MKCSILEYTYKLLYLHSLCIELFSWHAVYWQHWCIVLVALFSAKSVVLMTNSIR